MFSWKWLNTFNFSGIWWKGSYSNGTKCQLSFRSTDIHAISDQLLYDLQLTTYHRMKKSEKKLFVLWNKRSTELQKVISWPTYHILKNNHKKNCCFWSSTCFIRLKMSHVSRNTERMIITEIPTKWCGLFIKNCGFLKIEFATGILEKFIVFTFRSFYYIPTISLSQSNILKYLYWP